jgi:small subunit ribosomal protein S15e
MKPDCVKTHLRDMLVLPEMVGCVVGIHNGKTYNQVGSLYPDFILHSEHETL